ncbi:MAG: DUF4012 domain-containing protein [Patescibacteria group bacterium]|jgi:hypothetical protein
MNNINQPVNNKPINNEIKKNKIKPIHITLGIIGLFLLLILGSIYPAFDAYKYAMQGKQNLLDAENAIKDQNFAQAATTLKKSSDNFRRAKNDLYFLVWLKIIPYVGIQYSAADHLVKAAYNITSGLHETTLAIENIIKPLQSENVKSVRAVSENQKTEIIKNIYNASPNFAESSSKIEMAEIEINRIPTFLTLQKITDAKKQVNQYLPQINEIMKQVAQGSKLLPEALGYPNEQTYLFLLENNSELRPGGGFIGTYGIIKIKGGELTKLKTDNIYNLDYPSKIKVTPPWQILKYIDPKLKSLYFRDSNWSPDFPTNAEKAIWFYQQEGGEEKNIDGVVAITPTFIEYLLEVIGPIKARDETFNADNITEKVQQITTGAYEGKVVILEQKTRKGIIGDLSKSLLGKIFLLKKDKWPNMLKAIQKGFQDKQALVYFKDKNKEKMLEKNDFAGSVNQDTKNSDYLMVVDSNMASLKTDPFMERNIDYTIKPNGQAKVAITYTNNAVPALLTTRYRSWTRIYVPKGSEFLSVENNEKGLDLYNSDQSYEITEELNKSVFGTFINIETQETKTITYNYILPKYVQDQIKKGEYKIIVQKQAGVVNQNLIVNYNSTNPIKSIEPTNSGKIENNSAIFETKLQSDKEYTIKY